MDNILFINACARPRSRTAELAEALLEKLNGDVAQVSLYDEPLSPLDLQGIVQRDRAVQENDFSAPVFRLAKQFAAADAIVIATPYWDLMFPAVLKTYLENITVSGVTFQYSQEGRPQGLCQAKTLYYVTTAGGFIGENDFGFSYVQALAKNFFGITEIHRYTAEGLDIEGADATAILNKTKAAIDSDFQA